MKSNEKSEKYARTFKIACIANIFCGVFMVIRSFSFSSTATQMLINGGLNIAGIGVIVLVISLLIPMMLILSGVLGLLKKIKAAIVLSVIAFLVSLYSFVTNITTMVAMATEWKVMLANMIPAMAATAVPLIFVIYAVLTKKYPQE